MVERYLGGSVADLDFVGMVNSGMQIMHSNRLTFPSDLAVLFRVLVQLQGLGSSVGAVKANFFHALANLKKLLREGER